MHFHPEATQNWTTAFSVWIEDIQVQFQAEVVERVLRRGFLGHVRPMVRKGSHVLALLFSLHCTRPVMALQVPSASRTQPGQEAGEGPEMAVVEQRGLGTWYGTREDGFAWLPTASGELCNPEALTCAHRTLPLGSLVEVENLQTGRRLVVRVNDRGPYTPDRIIDLTARAARELGFGLHGTMPVVLRPLAQFGGYQKVAVAETPLTEETASNAMEPDVFRDAAASEVWNPGSRRLQVRAAGVNIQVGVPENQPTSSGVRHVRPPFRSRED